MSRNELSADSPCQLGPLTDSQDPIGPVNRAPLK